MKSKRRNRQELFERLTESHRRQSDNLWHYWQEDYVRQAEHNKTVARLRQELADMDYVLDCYEDKMADLDFYLDDYEQLHQKLKEENFALRNQIANLEAIDGAKFPKQFIENKPMYPWGVQALQPLTGGGAPKVWQAF